MKFLSSRALSARKSSSRLLTAVGATLLMVALTSCSSSTPAEMSTIPTSIAEEATPVASSPAPEQSPPTATTPPYVATSIQDWCDHLFASTNVDAFIAANRLDAGETPSVTAVPGDNGTLLMCNGGNFITTSGEYLDEATAQQRQGDFDNSALGQTDLGEEQVSLGGVSGEFTYIPGSDTGGGATFTAGEGKRMVSMSLIIFGSPVPTEEVIRSQFEAMLTILMHDPLPIGSTDAVCTANNIGELSDEQTSLGIIQNRHDLLQWLAARCPGVPIPPSGD